MGLGAGICLGQGVSVSAPGSGSTVELQQAWCTQRTAEHSRAGGFVGGGGRITWVLPKTTPSGALPREALASITAQSSLVTFWLPISALGSC